MKAVLLHDRDGRRCWAFDHRTDPYEVLHAAAWSHPEGVSSCDWPCPTVDGQYCLECHTFAANARTACERRFPIGEPR